MGISAGGAAAKDTQVNEHPETKQGRAQIAVVAPVERACPAASGRIQNDQGDDGDGGRSSWERSIKETRNC